MSWTHVRGLVNNSMTGTSGTVTLGAAPATGNTVCLGVLSLDNAITALTCKDSNNNSYLTSTNSPSNFLTSAGQVWLMYLVNAPANATATLNFTWTTASGTMTVWADEFSNTGGTPTFDKDAKQDNGGAGSTINTPSITPTNTGELLYSIATPTGAITAPTAGGTNGVWTGSAGAITNSAMAEYDLSATGATAVNYTCSGSTNWEAMVMAFTVTGSFQPDEDLWNVNSQQNPDPVTTVWQ